MLFGIPLFSCLDSFTYYPLRCAATSTDMPNNYLPDEIPCLLKLEPTSKPIGRELESLSEDIFERIKPHFKNKPRRLSRGDYLKHVGFVLMTLLRGHSINPNYSIILPTSNSAYDKGTKLKRKGFRAGFMRNIMAGLEAEGLIESFGSRVHPAQVAIDKVEYKNTGNGWGVCEELEILFDSVGLIPEMFKRPHKVEEIRNPGTKKHIPQRVKRTSEKALADKRIKRINTLLQTTIVELDRARIKSDEAEVVWKSCDRTRSTLRRIYTGDRNRGGRFFGHWVQQLPKDLRLNYLKIGGERVAELDFKSFNFSLIYILEGLELTADPYQLSDHTKVSRSVVKRLVNAALNSQSIDEAVGGVNKENRQGYFVGADERRYPIRAAGSPKFKTMKVALEEVVERLHPQARKYLFSGFGLKAMKIESDIALEVLDGMAQQGYPTIGIHNSFVCQESKVGELEQEMMRGCREVLNGAVIPVDRK